MSGLLLQLPGDRGHPARHRPAGEAFRPDRAASRGALHQGREAATPSEGHDFRKRLHVPRPEDAALHRLRGAAGRMPRLSRQQALRLLRVPEVRARPPGRPEVHRFDLSAFSRIAESVVAGVIASGSIFSSMMAGLPAREARSKAGAKSSVRSTVSPWPPNARAYAAKSGFFRSVPNTRPGYSRSWCMRIVP